jgi:PAS domain S-box-containing protein
MPSQAGAMLRGGWRIGLTAAAIAIVAAVGLFAVREFAADQRARDLRAWQSRLSVVADSRADAVTRWVAAQYDTLSDIADNLSVQLYVTELATQPAGARTPDALAQMGYLENLLRAVASHGGYVGPEIGPAVEANVRRVGVAGIALLDRDGAVVAATPTMPPMDGRLGQFLAASPAAARAMLDLYVDDAGRVAVAFAVPVYAVQGDRTPDQLVGRVVGVREVDESLYPLLRQPGIPWTTAEAVLVRAKSAAVEYVSPLADGTRPLNKTLARDTRDLAAAFALDHPNGFAEARDYRDARVLVAARPIADTPWTLLYKIDRAEALADDEARLARLTVALLLAVALVTAALVAAWRHGASRRSERAAAELAALARRYDAQRALLQLVTDSQPHAISIVDRDGRYRFANRVAGEQAGIAPADMLGKAVASVLGPAAAEAGLALGRQALTANETVRDVRRSGANGSTRVVQTSRVPVPGPDGAPDAVLVVEEDITAAVMERERRERIQRELVATLVRLVDRRDPFAADHSGRVAEVARAIAGEMDLDAVTAETAETAGALMNLGKILVPPELLTRAGGLSNEELRRVHEGLDHAADFLGGVEFDGPVVETLRQLRERWDGGGPRGLAGEAIVLPARVVAVANAFVAMVSPRAFRAGLDFDAATERLLGESGRAYDRRVVTALLNRLDNRGGRTQWARFRDAPAPDTRPAA